MKKESMYDYFNSISINYANDIWPEFTEEQKKEFFKQEIYSCVTCRSTYASSTDIANCIFSHLQNYLVTINPSLSKKIEKVTSYKALPARKLMTSFKLTSNNIQHLRAEFVKQKMIEDTKNGV